MSAEIVKRLGVAVGLALLWSVLAALNPTTTYHFAPLLVAVWPALSERHVSTSIRLASGGLLIAAITTALLSLAGFLEGPSVLPFGEATAESLVAGVMGAAISVVPAVVVRFRQQT